MKSQAFARVRSVVLKYLEPFGVPTFHDLKVWAKALKRDVIALWIAARCPETPWLARAGAGAVAAYALSPIDLIPDFIPVIGYLDDLILVPIGILLVVRLVPPPLMERFRALATARSNRPRSYVAAFVFVALWLAACIVLANWWRESRT